MDVTFPMLAAHHAAWWTYDEAPPDVTGFWIGLGVLAFVLVAVPLVLRHRRRRRLRASSKLPEDPFAQDAMQAAVRIFCALEPAWRERERSALASLVSPVLMRGWREQLVGPAARELTVDGPVLFQYMGAADPGPQCDRRAVVRVEGRLRAPSRQLSISTRQRRWLLGLAGAILLAAFAGIALAPASRIRSAPATTILVRDGVPLGGTHLLTYRKGALINLTVRSDVADEVHFHGYDIHKDVAPGHPVHFLIRASIEGSYPVELERHAQTLAQVTVQP